MHGSQTAKGMGYSMLKGQKAEEGREWWKIQEMLGVSGLEDYKDKVIREKVGEAGRDQISMDILIHVKELDCIPFPQVLALCPIPPHSQYVMSADKT